MIEIAAEAESWIGTPFVWQAACKGVGADCKGLLAGVARECGRPEARTVEALCGDYSAIVPVARLRSGLARLFDRVSERQPGDILLIACGGKAQHLAIAAPQPGKPYRVIEAMHNGPMQVRPFKRETVDSVWRWRCL